MFDVRITAVRRADHRDLQALYENPIEQPCCVREGDSWTSVGARQPDGLCDSAWQTMQPFVRQLAEGGGDFYPDAGPHGWMRNPYSAMVSCNDGFRPVSFLLERL